MLDPQRWSTGLCPRAAPGKHGSAPRSNGSRPILMARGCASSRTALRWWRAPLRPQRNGFFSAVSEREEGSGSRGRSVVSYLKGCFLGGNAYGMPMENQGFSLIQHHSDPSKNPPGWPVVKKTLQVAPFRRFSAMQMAALFRPC